MEIFYVTGLVLLLMSIVSPCLEGVLPVSCSSALLIVFAIFLPNIELLVRIWTFDSKFLIYYTIASIYSLVSCSTLIQTAQRFSTNTFSKNTFSTNTSSLITLKLLV